MHPTHNRLHAPIAISRDHRHPLHMHTLQHSMRNRSRAPTENAHTSIFPLRDGRRVLRMHTSTHSTHNRSRAPIVVLLSYQWTLLVHSVLFCAELRLFFAQVGA